MVAKHYGKSYSLQALRSRAFIAKSGVSMLGISDAAESIGFRTRGYRLTWEQLRDEVPLPPSYCRWNHNHFFGSYLFQRSPYWRKNDGVNVAADYLINQFLRK